jgi:hypothetical protein
MLVWEPGSDKVGDFTWTVPGVAITQQVVEALRGGGVEGFDPGPVEMVDPDDEDLRTSKEPRVTLPYQGPPLFELWPTAWVHLDRERSSVELERVCGTCGLEFWLFCGIERWDSHFDQEHAVLVYERIPRAPRGGIFLPEADLEGAGIFRVREAPAWIFCTEAVRALIEKHNFSNVVFWEMGDTF